MNGSARKIVGVIPARLESQRLPRKALRAIAGHPMLAWVYFGARAAPSLSKLLVATDSEEILACCREYAIPSLLTSRDHRSGTDRLVEVVAREPAEIYVNIQGDEPMVTAAHIEALVAPFTDPETQVATLKVPTTLEESRNPNSVKVVTDAAGRALYFSRAPIPFDRDAMGKVRYYKHLGFYAYTAEALRQFSRLAPSPLEFAERLEQLRFLENGIPMAVVEARDDTIGVDTEENLRQVERYFERTGARLSRG